jgi:hypothetical protein
MANHSMPNPWILDVAKRVMGLLLTEHDISAAVRPEVETVPPEELATIVAAVTVSEDGVEPRLYRIQVLPPSQAGNDADTEARRIVAQFLSRRGWRR